MKSLCYFTLLLACCIGCGNLSAQYNLLWQNPVLQDWGNDYHPVSADQQGNTIHAGFFENSFTIGNITLTANNMYGTAYIAKQDAAGTSWLWAKKITPATSSGLARISNLITDNSGNIYITGTFSGSVNFDNISLTGYNSQAASLEFFVAKMNSSGIFLWAKKEGSSTGDDEGLSVALDGSGNVYCTGYLTNKKINCKVCAPSLYQTDIYVVKYNNSGTKLWEKRYATNSATHYALVGNDVITDASGNVYITGHFIGTVSFGKTSDLSIAASSRSIYIARLNSSGTAQWVRSASSNSSDAGNTLLIDNTNNVYLGGLHGAGISIGNNSISGSGGFLAKYNSSGSVLWAVGTATPVVKVFTHPSGNIGIAGYRDVTEVAPANGSFVTSQSFDPSTFDQTIKDITLTPSGYVFSAISCGTANFANLTLTSGYPCSNAEGKTELFLLQYTTPSVTAKAGIGSPSIQPYLKAYPNPIHGKLIIESDKPLGVITVLDISGRQIMLHRKDQNTVQLDLSNLPPGLYFLKTEKNTKPITLRKL